jgi:hypothetical protein
MTDEPRGFERCFPEIESRAARMHRAPRCGARNRTGQPCRAPAIRDKKRCQMHGGKSTGPRTAEGLARSKRSKWVHGYYSAEAIAERKEARRVVAAIEKLTD